MKLYDTVYLVIFIVIGIFTFSSCNKDDDPINPEPNNFFLTVNFDGSEFSANSSDPLVSNNSSLTQIFTITGINNDGGRLTLTLPSPISEGTFDTDSGALLSYVSPTIEIWGAEESSSFGTITISNNNESFVEGTFSFTGTNPLNNETKEFTDGKFKAKKL